MMSSTEEETDTPRRKSTSTVASIGTDYSYKEDDETPLKPSYDEEEALVTALEESRQDALYDRISRAMEQFTLQQPAEKEKEFEEKKNDGVQMFELAKRTPLEAVTDNIVSPSTIKKSGHVAEAGRAPPPPEDS